MKPVVVGIGGKIGAGKDAIARHLVAHHNVAVVRFADALKEEVLCILRKTSVEVWKAFHDTAVEPSVADLRRLIWDDKPPIMRRLLQEWGTELRRAEDPEYWIKRWEAEARRVMLVEGKGVAAPDARFQNEVDAVRRLGGVFVRVLRPGTVSGDHASELEADAISADWTFHNTESLDHLFQAVDDYVDYLGRVRP